MIYLLKANETQAWQQLVVLAHNLLTKFQLETGSPHRRRTRKHTVIPCCGASRRSAFALLHRAAHLALPSSGSTKSKTLT